MNPSKGLIAILVDNPLRDLPAAVLLALELIKSDFSVLLLPTAHAPYNILKYKPQAIVLNYLRHTNLSLVSLLQNYQVKTFVLDTEGGIFLKMNDQETSYTKTLVQDKSFRQYIAKYYVWGQNLFEYLLQNGIYSSDQLVLTGTPRMDFFSDRLKPYFKNTKKKIILLATSFPLINPRFKSPEDEIKVMKSFGYSLDFLNLFTRQLLQVQKAYMDSFKIIAKSFPHEIFIMRPHPFESDLIYKNEFKNFPNIQVVQTKTIDYWLQQSKALIHYECSTALEAAFADVPSLSLVSYKEVRPSAEAQMLTDFCKDDAEICQKLQNIIENKYSLPSEILKNRQQIENEIYYQVDGFASRRIAQDISQYFLKHQTSPAWKKTFSLQLIIKLFLLKIRAFLKKLYRGYLVPPLKNFNQTDVDEILTNLQNVDDLPFAKTIWNKKDHSIFINKKPNPNQYEQ